MPRTVITGGAGFVGSHLCDRFVAEGHDVVCVDNCITGATSNIEDLKGNPRFTSLKTRICRIFNTYGERMRLDDGRVLPNLMGQALRGAPLTIYGDGAQTRSFCYVSDLVDGIYRLLHADFSEPVNLGNPNEVTIQKFAEE